MSSESEICREQTKTTFGKDKISALHDDLILHILCLIPTEVAVTTMILSKRWRFIWTLLSKLEYKHAAWNFLDKSLQLHKAPTLKSLHIKLIVHCSANVDIENWVSNSVGRFLQELRLTFIQTVDPEIFPQSLPKSLYTCKTLVKLNLCGDILVDVPSLTCLPSVESITLSHVVYEDQDSHVKLLSSCPNLKDLFVERKKLDNFVATFIVKVPSLQKLTYFDLQYYFAADHHSKALVIDSPGLNYLKLSVCMGYNVSIKNLPCLDEAMVSCPFDVLNEKFMTCFSSVMFLNLSSNKVSLWSAINFSRLIELELDTDWSDNWLEPLVLLLHNAPKLKALMITIDEEEDLYEDPPFSWNQPSHVPVCLLSHLEIFQWKKFRGTSKGKQFLAWILANSKCLKKVGIKVKSSKNNDEEKKRIMEDELESMFRVSTSSQLMFTDELHWRC
ncbi:unnamed protein product [Cochlearia groenlandica]